MSTAGQTRVGRPRATPAGDADVAPRIQILNAAAALFAEFGYAGTSTRAIAERVGIRQASLYYHFAGKDEILLELLETSVRPSLEFVERLRRHDDPAAALFALAAIDVGTLLATPHNIGTLYLAHEVQQPRFLSFRHDRATLQDTYVALAASIRPDGDAAFLGACCMQLVEIVIQVRRDGEPAAGIAGDVARSCLRLLGAEQPQSVAAGEALRAALLTP